MNESNPTVSAETGGTEITRFNALRHGVLSRYTVLPWEDADEYRALVAALAAEHAPQGPTEEHLVEELAGILWRKRRLRLAEAPAHRRGLDGTLGSYRETVKVALVHLDDAGQSESVVDAIRATATDTEEEMADVGVAPCQCFSSGGNQTTSPGRISSMGPPSRCTHPQPTVTIRVWPSGCVCQAVRAPGSKVTLAPLTRAGSGAWNSGSTRTAPVK
jgi:hypothetical protein